MNFRKFLKCSQPVGVSLVMPVNIFLLAIFLIFLMFFLSGPSKIGIRIPKVVTSDIVNDDNIIIVITSDNLMYKDGHVITVDELRDFLRRPDSRKLPLLVKADRRASVGRIIDIWNLGRDLGIQRISIATDSEE